MATTPVTDTAGRAVWDTLHAYGVRAVFGIPGTHNLELYRPLVDLGIRVVTTRHEQGAGYAADGWSQQTGLPGVVITTSGPGLQNVMSAVGTAYCESRPLLILSPGPALGQAGAGGGTLHETKDSTGMVASVAEWSLRVSSAAEAVEALHAAFALWRTSRPRPVHIEIPLDVLEAPADVSAEARRARAADGTPRALPDDVHAAAALLRTAQRPVLIVGGGATKASLEITTLAERLGAPVLTTLNGKATVDERHPLSVGAQLRLSAARAYAEDADVVVVIGSKLGEAELWVPRLQMRGQVIRIDIAAEQMHAGADPVIALHGSARETVEALCDALGAGNASWPDLAAIRSSIRAELIDAAPAVVALGERIVAALPDDAVVAGDSSQIVYLAVANLLTQSAPHSLLYMPTYATLGYGLPAAIGACVAAPERPVVTVLGDGALMFSVNELATAREQGLNLTIVCVDNGGYAEIKQNEQDRGIEPVGVDLWQPDWVALARAFGAGATSIDAAAEGLEQTIRAAIARGGLQLVHVNQRG